MTEVTKEGWFELFLRQNSPNECNFYFYRNADILDCGCLTSDPQNIEPIKHEIAQGNSRYKEKMLLRLERRRNFDIPFPKISIDPKDFALLSNKIYCKGLTYVDELAKTGGVLEITDEDREFFEESSKK